MAIKNPAIWQDFLDFKILYYFTLIEMRLSAHSR